ncbi:MAG: tetratricopeptide repeat protein [Acidobacteria bacterium]|nr:tetratricopeptide repeat protein [Acidobacteriota bacterium]
MKKIIFLTLCAALLAGCAVHRYHSEFAFANKLLQEGLWQEAIFRLEKARAAGNDSAALHNNLAVALEGLGRADEAEREYQAALKLAPANEQIRLNLDKLKKNQRKDADEKK